MALWTNRSRCPLCSLPLRGEVTEFPAFAATGEKDPLWIFNDEAVHTTCLNKHPLGVLATQRKRLMGALHLPSNRVCKITGDAMLDPDDHFGINYFPVGPTDELATWSLAQMKKSALASWDGLDGLIELLETRLAEEDEFLLASIQHALMLIREVV